MKSEDSLGIRPLARYSRPLFENWCDRNGEDSIE